MQNLLNFFCLKQCHYVLLQLLLLCYSRVDLQYNGNTTDVWSTLYIANTEELWKMMHALKYYMLHRCIQYRRLIAIIIVWNDGFFGKCMWYRIAQTNHRKQTIIRSNVVNILINGLGGSRVTCWYPTCQYRYKNFKINCKSRIYPISKNSFICLFMIQCSCK